MALRTRPAMSLSLLRRGRQRYDIYCAVCHDVTGGGNGVVPSRGFPHPPGFLSSRVRALNSAQIVDVITHGYGVMYSYADRVPPQDRWAIAAYVRALQMRAAAPRAVLSPTDLVPLDNGDD
jgi:mono/diheme cytochrome c family protein